MSKRFIFTLLICFAAMQTVFAQVQFTAQVDKNKLTRSDRLEVKFSVNQSADDFVGPSFSDFTILAGPNQRFENSYINGRRSQKTIYTYFLRAKKEGQLTIGEASISVSGKTYKSKPIRVFVSDKYVDENDPVTKARKNIYLRALLSKNKVYKGEQLIVTYKLYYTEDIRNLNSIDEPELEGFWKQDIDIGSSYTVKEEVIGGKRFNTIVLKKQVLIPQKTGELVLDPMELELPVYIATNRRDIFSRPIKEPYTFNVSSGKKTIRVKPLPREGKPAGFSGAVGQFDFECSLSKDSVETNESINLKVSLTGKGNITLAELPKFDIPSVIETYDPKYEEKIKATYSGLQGNKSTNYLLIPRNRGTYKIDSQEFSYFDPKQEVYKKISSPEFSLKVFGENQVQTSVPIGSRNQEEVAFIGKDILFIKTIIPEFIDRGEPFYGSKLFYLLLILPIVVTAILSVVLKNRRNQVVDVKSIKNKRASKVANQRLKKVKSLMDASSNDAFYEELSGAMWGYLSDKLAIPASRLSKENVEEMMSSKNASKAHITECKQIIESCEFARFAGGGSSSAVSDLYKRAVSVIEKLENEL